MKQEISLGMSRPSFLRLFIVISLASLLGYVLLTWIWNARTEFEEKLVDLQNKSSAAELLGAPDYSFSSKTEMIDEIAGGNFVFELLPARSETINIHELPEITGTACFYVDSFHGYYLIYFDGDEIVAVYWAAT